MPKPFACRRVGQVNFDYRHVDGLDRIEQGYRRVCIRSGVQQHRLGARGVRLVQPVDQYAFMIGLTEVDDEADLARLLFQHCGNIGQGGRTVNLWLTRAEQVEVGAVEDEDNIGHAAGLAAIGRTSSVGTLRFSPLASSSVAEVPRTEERV